MNFTLRFLLGFLACGVGLSAQPLQRGNVDLRVGYEIRIKTKNQWQTSWGDFSEDYINTRILELTLNQIGRGDSTVTINWYFVGRDYDAEHLFIYDAGEFTGDISRGGVKLLPYSKELISNREKLFGGNQLTGSHPWGWCVIVSQKGNILEEKASTPELIKWTHDHRGNSLPERRTLQKSLRFIPQALGMRPTEMTVRSKS